MKNFKTVIIIFFSIIFSANMCAQDDLINMKKYWFYHYRLVNDFMAKGEHPGESIPMEERAVYTPSSEICKWGDATCAQAQYIGVLATEYALLSQQGQPTDTTKQELFLALNALNRLDWMAESNLDPATIWPPPAPAINGFFIRDDVGDLFVQNHPKLAHGVTSQRPVKYVESDFNDANKRDKEVSVDQIYHLMVGFALVRKFIPENTYFIPDPTTGVHKPFMDGETDIWKEAKIINDRYMDLMGNYWTIYLPGTTTKVYRGPEAFDASYGAAEAACYIENRNSTPTGIPYPIHSCNEYHNFVSKTDAPLWMSLGGSLGPIAMLSSEDYKLQSLAAIGNSWWTRPQPFFPDPIATTVAFFNPYNIFHPWQFVTQLVTQTVVPPINVTMPNLATRAAFRDNQHLPLLRQILHGGSNPIPQQKYVDLLNSAPTCGPYNYDYPNNASTFEWSSDSRLYNSERRGEYTADIPYKDSNGNWQWHLTGDDKVGNFHGEYNGLDYMLYYNLFHIIEPNTVPMVNYMDRVITFTFPDANGSGSASNPTAIIAFNTITASNTVNSTANVTYRAGNEIALKSGFSVKSGANFHAYVQPFDCGEYINPSYRSMISNDTSNQSPTDNLVAYTGQTTFINYPKRDDETENVSDNYNADAQNTNLTSSNKTQYASEKIQTVSGINILPNPNNGTFQIAITHNNQSIGVKSLKVFDIMGKIIWSTEISTNTLFTIDISSYSPGIYYVRSINQLDETETKKLIKQ